ncbi:MAG: SpoIIIAH-like family protein [Firmicutes bacterium]|nr:SpoIIIAH-like family protein [Bacillota bacterium]
MQTRNLQKSSNILIFNKYNLIDKTGGIMINKKSLWFLTLFSLILVLSIYYITMPSELLLTTNVNNTSLEENNEEVNVDIEESDLLVALRVESDEEMTSQIEELQLILTNAESSVDDKNKAYEKIKELNDTRGEEEKLETQVKDVYKLDSFIKINDNQIQVTINSSEHSENLANNIMRTIQSNYEESKYITVKFQK